MEVDLQIRATGKFGNRGERYEILLGAEIIASGTSPEFAACRVLKERGMSGSAVFWRQGKEHAQFRMPIEWAAEHCVVENAKIGPRFGKWSPSPFADKADEGVEELAGDQRLFAIHE